MRLWCAVTLAALVLVTSACASTAVPGSPVAAGSSVPTAVTTAAPDPNPTPVNSTRWIDVTGQGSVRMDTTGTPTQFGPQPNPGLAILSDPGTDGPGGFGSLCTLGPAIRDDAGDREGFVTSKNCPPPNSLLQWLQTAAIMDENNLQGDYGVQVLGELSDEHPGSSVAALWGNGDPLTPVLDPGFKVGQSAVRIADTWPVAGVMAAASASMSPSRADGRPPQSGLRQGTPVCLNGAASGVVCGPLIDPGDTEGGDMEFGVSAAREDEGAPVFLVNGDTGAATLIGVAASTKGGSTFVSLLEPELMRLKAVALVDATAAATVAGHPDYSVNERINPALLPRSNWICADRFCATAPAAARSVSRTLVGVVAPGANIAVVGTGGCTLGPGIRRGDQTGFLTAGHCGDEGEAVRLDSVTGAQLGVLSDAEDTDDGVARVGAMPTRLDYAAVWTNDSAPRAATVAGLPVAGVMTREGAMTLESGTPVCYDGRTSGLVCAPLIGAYIEDITNDVGAVGGDSGSPAFIVDGDTGTAILLGITSQSREWPNDDQTWFTYLDPSLERLGAQALVDPAAAATVAGDPRYSTRVTPLN